ncbi:MAG TPA: hypothetical protein VJY62_07880, partial [Bacteroidia bacterium]|nr:hypothetical protein [Bacteroidia bacterium]
MKLLKKQEIELFKILTDNGFNPLEFKYFDFKNDLHGLDYKFIFKNETGYTFYIEVLENGYFKIKYSPGEKNYQEDLFGKKILWIELTQNFDLWFKCLKNELSLGDTGWFWYKKLSKDFEASDYKFEWSPDNKEFTFEEKIYLKGEFDDVKKIMFEIGIGTANELQIIKDEIENLKDKLDLLNKPDFMKQVFGSLTSYIPKMVSEEVVKQLWVLFKEKFSTEIH